MEQAWRVLVDLERLAAWMDGRDLETGLIVDPKALVGGTQNVLLMFRRGQRSFVLRRPPAHPHLDGNETMRREARVLAALANTSVPHPRLIASCDDSQVLGAGFYLMEPVAGFSPTVALPEPFASDPVSRRRMGFAMVDAIADLAAIDYVAAGLDDFGRLDHYLERQVSRWRRQLDSYQQYAGWPGFVGIPGVGSVSSWLSARQPEDFRPGIVHGDYSLGNAMFRHDAPELAAIVDWELATLGDPLLDLGWLLATWCDADGTGIVTKLEVAPWEGFPRPEELVARYAERSGRDMAHSKWFAVLACYKLGIILEGSHARGCAGKASMETGEILHRTTIKLFERALNWMERTD